MAHHDLLGLRVELFAYEPFGPRAWELRGNLTTYDAWYVALAEDLGSPLATLDRRLSRAAGPRCGFLPRSIQSGIVGRGEFLCDCKLALIGLRR